MKAQYSHPLLSVLTWTCPILYLKQPRSLGFLPPVVGGHKSPVIKSLPRDISLTSSQEGGFCVSWRCQVDLDFTSFGSGESNSGLDMLEVLDVIFSALTAVSVHGNHHLAIHGNLSVWKIVEFNYSYKIVTNYL